MKMLVERMLTEVRGQLRQMPSNVKVVKSTPDRQKLLVSVTQEVNRSRYNSLSWLLTKTFSFALVVRAALKRLHSR
jgi:hypothetical protein